MKRKLKRKTRSFFSLLLALAMMVSLTAQAGPVRAGSVIGPEDTAVESSDSISDETPAEDSGSVSDGIYADSSDETSSEGSGEVPVNSGEEMLLTSADAEGYVVTFSLGEGASIDVYYTHDYTTANEVSVTTAYARSSDTGEIDSTGDGQVNFLVNLKDGYELVSVSADDNYKNLKDSSDTGVENLYRLTKITGSVTVTVTTQKTENTEVPTSVSSGTVWSFWEEESDPAGDSTSENYSRTSWTLADYDDSAWMSAAGSFGSKNGTIADLGSGYIPNTLLTQYKSGSSDDIEAYFFRTTVSIEDASAVTAIIGSVIYDDAATIYINGVRIAGFDDSSITANMQYGGSNAGTPKTGDINITDQETLSSVLVNGENIIAVEIHQGRASSSDIYFDMPSLVFSTEPVEVQETTAQSSISLSVGLDETQRNFTWYAQTSGTGTLYLAKNSEVSGDTMPENAAAYSVTGEEATNKSGYYSYQTTVTGLEANTTYAYQLENNGSKSAIYTFTTGSDDGSFSFAMVGDPQIGAGTTATDIEGWENTLNIVGSSSVFSGVDFLLSLGDQVNTASDEEQYDGYLEHSVLYGLTTATVIGNHDSSSVAYSEHFNLTDTNDNSYGSSTAGADYYFVYNGVLFMVLNSNNTSAAEHKQFMQDAIDATADQEITWKVVAFHHSIYSVASHALEDSIISRREQLVPIFEELDIDVVLMGHDHVYARTYIMDGFDPITDADAYDDDTYSSITDPDGILYVTANSASGSKYYNIQTNVNFEYAAVMNQDYTPNVSLVDVTANSFTITTYETGSMSVVDTFTIYKTSETEEPDDQGSGDDLDNTGDQDADDSEQTTSDTTNDQTSGTSVKTDPYWDQVIAILAGDYSGNVALTTGTNGEMIVKILDTGVELSIDQDGNKVLTIDGTVNNIDTLPNSLMKFLLNDGNTKLVFTYFYPEASSDDAASGQPYGQLVTITIHPGEATDDDIEWYGPAWLYAKYGASASDSSAADTTGSDTVEPASTGSAKTGDDSLMTIWVLTLLLLAGALTMIDNRLKNHR